MEMWLMFPEANFPYSFLTPSILRSSIKYFQSFSTLFLVKEVLASTTTVRQPSSWVSIAVLKGKDKKIKMFYMLTTDIFINI